MTPPSTAAQAVETAMGRTGAAGAGEPTDALLGVYRPAGPVFVGGEGSWLIAEDGRRYLDLTSGIAVNALGHGAPQVEAAVREALETGLVHASNLFRTRPAAELAAWLTEHSFADRVFFANSGAEANEGALKFARRWARERGGDAKTEIVAFAGGFHGRTLGALSATDRPAYQDPFRPLLPGVRFCEPGDLDSLDEALHPARTAAVLIEPIQAEGGVRLVDAGFLRTLRERCDAVGALLLFDEVQVGLGRTGTLWAHEQGGVTPDVMTLAKPLAGGLPMGAVLLTHDVAAAVRPGDHGSTFGGGPLVASVALAVCRAVSEPYFLEAVRANGRWLGEALDALARGSRQVAEVRGRGLIWGLELRDETAAEVVAAARERGLLLCSAGPDVVRLLPPLNATLQELELAVDTLKGIIS